MREYHAITGVHTLIFILVNRLRRYALKPFNLC